MIENIYIYIYVCVLFFLSHLCFPHTHKQVFYTNHKKKPRESTRLDKKKQCERESEQK